MKQLGEFMGVSESCISQYENGKREPDNNTLIKLADFFEVSVDYLLGADTENKILNKRLKTLLGDTEDYSNFANAIGVKVSDVAMWLKGISFSCYDKISEISEFFNVSLDYLLGKSDTFQTTSVDEELDGIQFALHGEIHDLTDEEKAKILEFVKFTKSQRKDN